MRTEIYRSCALVLVVMAAVGITGCWDWQRFEPLQSRDGGLEAGRDAATDSMLDASDATFDAFDAAPRCGADGMACCADGGTVSCARGLACIAMHCTACPSGLLACNDACVDSTSDPAHCGSCSTQCATSEVCAAGVCSAPPPPNDTRDRATVIDTTTSNTLLTADTAGAHHDATGPCACANGRDVFFVFTLARPEIVYADTFGSSFDTALFLQDALGNDVVDSHLQGGATCNNRNANGCSTSPGSVVTAKLFDGTYYLVLSGCAAGRGRIRFQHLPAGSGAHARLPSMPGATQQITGTLAGTGTIESTCCSDGPEDTYWWTTCPDAQTLTLHASTCGTAAFNTELDQRSAGRAVVGVCNDDACGQQSQLDASIPSGAGLHTLYVDSCSDAGAGDYALNVTFGSCASGTLCSARCMDLQSDPMHCGACTMQCPLIGANTVPRCTAGTCGFSCMAGFGDCTGDPLDGCEATLDTIDHCGACIPCSTANCTPSCAAGVCAVACNAGYGDCDGRASTGCEVNLQTNDSNCGVCGRRCNGNRHCVNGVCI